MYAGKSTTTTTKKRNLHLKKKVLGLFKEKLFNLFKCVRRSYMPSLLYICICLQILSTLSCVVCVKRLENFSLYVFLGSVMRSAATIHSVLEKEEKNTITNMCLHTITAKD